MALAGGGLGFGAGPGLAAGAGCGGNFARDLVSSSAIVVDCRGLWSNGTGGVGGAETLAALTLSFGEPVFALVLGDSARTACGVTAGPTCGIARGAKVTTAPGAGARAVGDASFGDGVAGAWGNTGSTPACA